MQLDHGSRDVAALERAFARVSPADSAYTFNATSRAVAEVEVAVNANRSHSGGSEPSPAWSPWSSGYWPSPASSAGKAADAGPLAAGSAVQRRQRHDKCFARTGTSLTRNPGALLSRNTAPPWVATGPLIAGVVFLLAGALLTAPPVHSASRKPAAPASR